MLRETHLDYALLRVVVGNLPCKTCRSEVLGGKPQFVICFSAGLSRFSTHSTFSGTNTPVRMMKRRCDGSGTVRISAISRSAIANFACAESFQSGRNDCCIAII
jgi:hypothetical protein